MRTLRKVLCLLCLTALVTSSTAMAAPADRSDNDTSARSWALSVLNSVVAFFAPDEIGGAVDPNGLTVPSGSGQAGPPDEIGGSLDPNGPPAPLDEPQKDEYGGGIEPNG